MSDGLIVVFSGMDGAGKSTQIDRLWEHWRQDGRNPMRVWTRGGYTPLFEYAKAVWRRLRGRSAPPRGHSARRAEVFSKPAVRRVWLTIAQFELLWICAVQLRWWRWRGRRVICDRFTWDTLLDFRLNFPTESVENGWQWRLLEWAAARPDATFLLLVPVAVSIQRSDIKGEPFRDTADVLAVRLAEYQMMSQRHPAWRVLDGEHSMGALSAEILGALDDVLTQRDGAHQPSVPTRLDR